VSDRFKFRAWDTDGKFMKDHINLMAHRYYHKGDTIFNDSEYIIMQSTGLKDKNGKLIYEGDILASHHYSVHFLHHIVTWSEEYSQWRCNSMGAKDKHDGCAQMFVYMKDPAVLTDGCEIIGNIYENPELLEAS